MRQSHYNNTCFEKEQPTISSDTYRKLNRRINKNIGLLNGSRQTNNSGSQGSLTMRRTELSNQKMNLSRDKDTSNMISGINSQDILYELNGNDSGIIRKIGSLFNIQKNSKSGQRIVLLRQSRSNQSSNSKAESFENKRQKQPIHTNLNKNYVENVYMLSSQMEKDKYIRKKAYYQEPTYAHSQKSIPQSPHLFQSRESERYQRLLNQVDQFPKSPQYKYGNYRSPQQKSILRSSHSKDKNQRIRQSRKEAESPRSHNLNYLEAKYRNKRQSKRQYNQIQIRESQQRNYNNQEKYRQKMNKRNQEKYLQNLYELNSPREKQFRQKKSPHLKKRIQNPHSDKIIYDNYYLTPRQEEPILPYTSKYKNGNQPCLPLNSIASVKNGRKLISSKQKYSIKLDQPMKNAQNEMKFSKQKVQEELSTISIRMKQKNQILNVKKSKDIEAQKYKVIQQKSDTIEGNNIFLPVHSKQNQKQQEIEDIMEKVILHLQSLNILAQYVKEFKKMYDNVEPWEQLIFLVYKKFYMERIKVQNILRDDIKSVKRQGTKDTFDCHQSSDLSKNFDNQENPFLLPYSKITNGQLDFFRKSAQCTALKFELQNQNNSIRSALRGLYNLYIEKSGEYINMLECDNFSDEIYRMMKLQIEQIEQNLQISSLIMLTKQRLGRIIKSGLLVGYLNGKYIKNFAQILLHQDTVKVGKKETIREDCIYQLFYNTFKKTLV